TLTSYNCRPYLTGSNETCTLTPPAAGGTYYVMLNGYTAYSGVTLTATYSASGGGGGNVLTSGVPVTNISGASGSQQTWTLAVPSGPTSVRFNIAGSTSAGNDADLYVRFGAAPTTSTYDCRPYLTGSNETCNLSARVGTWYVMLRGYTAYSGVTLTGSYQ
ncbi:MAG TPA: PPC domain-containing protein, partial [Myxococcales bacterium]|nr:PPC domain-containing protein [Myxococcales bacterium]